MDTTELLIHDSAHPLTHLILMISLGIAIVGIITRILQKRSKHADEIAVPITYGILLTALFTAAFSGAWATLQTQADQIDKTRVDVSTIAKTLQTEYSVTHIDGGDPETGSSLDTDDVSNNTYNAQSITIDDRTYQRCQVLLSPSTERDKKTYTTIKLTCHDQADPQTPITLKPTK